MKGGKGYKSKHCKIKDAESSDDYQNTIKKSEKFTNKASIYLCYRVWSGISSALRKSYIVGIFNVDKTNSLQVPLTGNNVTLVNRETSVAVNAVCLVQRVRGGKRIQ